MLQICVDATNTLLAILITLANAHMHLTLFLQKTCFHVAKTHVVNDERNIFALVRSGSFVM